jgi:hypothetical protein
LKIDGEIENDRHEIRGKFRERNGMQEEKKGKEREEEERKGKIMQTSKSSIYRC